MLGDSLTAGYGLPGKDALPVRLEAELIRLGHPVAVTNAGVSGDTTADGLRRLNRDVAGDTQLCIVALGANDMMTKVLPERVQVNLETILSRLADRSIPAILCGIRAPPCLGAYAARFDAVFKRVATDQKVAFLPFLLEGVALHPNYTLADRIHPNAQGIRIVAGRLAPHVATALEALVHRPELPA
ncbi:MAG: arylesterase [Brevundimonas sp.]|nr:MAG: arylesterase [Brevundimonas sp.]